MCHVNNSFTTVGSDVCMPPKCFSSPHLLAMWEKFGSCCARPGSASKHTGIIQRERYVFYHKDSLRRHLEQTDSIKRTGGLKYPEGRHCNPSDKQKQKQTRVEAHFSAKLDTKVMSVRAVHKITLDLKNASLL